MSNLLTPAEVAEVRQRNDERTEGEWKCSRPDMLSYAITNDFKSVQVSYLYRPSDTADSRVQFRGEKCAKDAAFAAHASRDIPRLLADREALVKLLARAHGYLIQLVDDNDIFIDPEYVERVNEFCKEIEDAGVLAQVEERET